MILGLVSKVWDRAVGRKAKLHTESDQFGFLKSAEKLSVRSSGDVRRLTWHEEVVSATMTKGMKNRLLKND